MDQELKKYLDDLEARMSGRFQQVEALVEKLRDDVDLLGKAMIGTRDPIDFLRAETTGKLEGLRGVVSAIERSLISRLELLENRVEGANQDLLKAIRKRFGLRPTQ